MRPAILPLTAALLTTAVAGSAAATRGVPTRGAPVISGAGVAFHDPCLGFDLLGDGTPRRRHRPIASDLLVTVPFADLASPPKGALFVTTGSGQSFLPGDHTRVGFKTNPSGSDKIELLFG